MKESNPLGANLRPPKCRDVFLYPHGGRRLIFQPSEEQLDRLCSFLLTPSVVLPSEEDEENKLPSPLPITPEKYARRVDPWDAFRMLHIFRDRYERRVSEYRPRGHMVAFEDDPQAQNLLKEVQERFL